MQVLILFLIIGFLEQHISTDTGFLQLAVILHGGGCNIDIDAADSAVFVLDGIDGPDAFQHILDGAVHRVFAGFQCQTLVAHILQSDNLFANLFLGQLAAGNVLILVMIGTVETSVDTVVGQIQGGKNHDAVAVKGVLDFCGPCKNPLNSVLVLTQQQQNGFPMAQALVICALVDNLIHQLQIVFVLFCPGDTGFDFLIADKFFRFHGILVVHKGRFLSQ